MRIASSPDVLLYLLFTSFNALLYTLIKLFSINTGMKTLEIAAYMNIGVFVFYNIFFAKKIFQDKLYLNVFKLSNLVLSVSMVSAVTKIYCIQHIEPRDATVITHATPFLVMLFASFFLREKMNAKNWFYSILSFFGACVYVWRKIDIHNIYYVVLFAHMAFKAMMHIATRKVSKTSVFHVMFYDNFFYSLFAIGYFAHSGTFTVMAFTRWEIFAVIIVTMISLFGLVKSYSLAQNGISKLQNLDFSKIIFSFILGVAFLSDKVDLNEIVGTAIILISMLCSQIEFKKIKSKIGKKSLAI